MSKYYNISNTNFYLQCNSYLSEFLWIGWIQTDPKIRRITTPKKALTIGWPACRWHLRTSFQEAGTTLWRGQSLCLGDQKHPGESPQCHGLRQHSGHQKLCSKKITLRSLQLEVVLHEWSPLPGGWRWCEAAATYTSASHMKWISLMRKESQNMCCNRWSKMPGFKDCLSNTLQSLHNSLDSPSLLRCLSLSLSSLQSRSTVTLGASLPFGDSIVASFTAWSATVESYRGQVQAVRPSIGPCRTPWSFTWSWLVPKDSTFPES